MPATGRSTRVDLSVRIFFNYACYILRSSLLCTWNYYICSRRIIPSRGEVACKVEGLDLEARISASAHSAGTPWGHYATPAPRFCFHCLRLVLSLEMSCVPLTLFCNSFSIPFFCQFSQWRYWFTLATLSRLLTRLLNVRQIPLCMCAEKQNRVNIEMSDTVKYGSFLNFRTSSAFLLSVPISAFRRWNGQARQTARRADPADLLIFFSL